MGDVMRAGAYIRFSQLRNPLPTSHEELQQFGHSGGRGISRVAAIVLV